MYRKGVIPLERKERTFMAGFCIIHKELQDLESITHLLHPKETTTVQALKFGKRKSSYLLGRYAAKKALSILFPTVAADSILISSGIFKFPVIESHHIHNTKVSISHCDTIGIALAFPESHPIGVDIERVNEKGIDALKSVINDQEFNLLTSYLLPSSVCYTMIWTIKEGLSKILKTGLMADFNILEIESISKEGNTYISTFKNFAQYKAVSYCIDEYICTLVLPKNTSPILSEFEEAITYRLEQV